MMKTTLAVLALALLSVTASADTVLTYTGNATSDPFIVQFYAGHGYNPCGCALTASFTLEDAPTPGGAFDKYFYVPESWLVSVNGYSFTQNNSNLSLDFSFVNGAVDLWHFNGGTPSGLNFASYSYDLFEATDYGPGMGEQGNRGTWTAVTTPEPGTLALIGVGLAGLWARRRLQAGRNHVPKAAWEPLA